METVKEKKAATRTFRMGTVPYVLLFGYTFFITLSTWADAIFFLEDVQSSYYHVVGAVFTAILVIVLCRHYRFSFRRYSGSKLLLAFSAFIMVLTVLRAMIPDVAYDTLNYHLVAQKQFVQGFEENCAPGNFQLYGFALGDKLYYLPRLLFGYRVGSMLSGLILCLVLYQVSELLHLLCGDRLASLRERYFSGRFTKYFSFLVREEFWAFVAVFLHDNVMLLGSYYVDLFTLPFLLEAVYQLVAPQEESAEDAVYFILNAGFMFAIKMTNIVYLLPLVVLYLVKIRKMIKPGLFLLCLVLGFFPCAPYLLVNWVKFGNPVFPYYNTIFQSIYYSLTDFKDDRFGPQTLQEKWLWPFYMVFAPDYRQTEIVPYWTGGLAVGMLATVATAVASGIRCIRKKVVDSKILVILILTVASFVLWEITTSISRYYLGGYILMTCLLVWFCAEYLFGKNRLRNAVGVLCGTLVFLQVVSSLDEYQNAREWSWRRVTVKSITENISCLFRDRPSISSLPEEPAAFFEVDNSAGVSQILSPETPVYRLDYLYDTLSGPLQQNLMEEVDALMETGRVYMVSTSGEFGASTFEKLNRYGFCVDSFSILDGTIYDTARDVLLFHIAPLEQGKSNILYGVPCVMEKGDASHLTALCYIKTQKKSQYLQIQDENGTVVYTAPVYGTKVLNISVDLPETVGQTLEWVLIDAKGKEVKQKSSPLMIVDPKFQD